MVKFYSTSYDYDYSFPAVSLAYFLRYPNPYSTHVLSTDVIERSFDRATQKLTTVRLHLKKSKLPTAVLKLVPRTLLGASATGDSQSYILETSIVDVKQGAMFTESRNLEWTGVLSVIETQNFRRLDNINPGQNISQEEKRIKDKTAVDITVALRSHIGDNIRRRRARLAKTAAVNNNEKLEDDDQQPKVGFFKSWTTGSIQRSIELIGLKRAEGAQPKAKQGMTVVLERMRKGGLVAVLEGMRKDRELIMARELS